MPLSDGFSSLTSDSVQSFKHIKNTNFIKPITLFFLKIEHFFEFTENIFIEFLILI